MRLISILRLEINVNMVRYEDVTVVKMMRLTFYVVTLCRLAHTPTFPWNNPKDQPSQNVSYGAGDILIVVRRLMLFFWIVTLCKLISPKSWYLHKSPQDIAN
jgi:hypothetical protein